MNPNRLIHEKSPYLIQHAHNPVDWFPWSEEAFEAARADDRPIFLSIGYATCHWCHVMEKESFEDESAARILNETFLPIKVDREERPDIDAVYMAVCQMMTGSGGWPLTILMTPDRKPFFAATYIPRETRFGRMGLIDLSRRVGHLWRTDRKRIDESADGITGQLGRSFTFDGGEPLHREIFDTAATQIRESYDPVHGGFGPAPKFPTPHRLLFLLRYLRRHPDGDALDMVERTLSAMRHGGMWDHVGYGFHRYSTDREWLLPHFEKMLYDQALLSIAYLEAYRITGDEFYAGCAVDIFTYVLRDMTSPGGAFYAAEDADSDGEEGKFYVWNLEDFQSALGPETAEPWAKIFNLREKGNFIDEATGRQSDANILHLKEPMDQWARTLSLSPEEMENNWRDVRQKLYTFRESRVHPLKDDKILTDWNGLMIGALAVGSRTLDRPEYAEAASHAVQFILERMQDENGQLRHRYRDGSAGISAMADDTAFLVYGLLELFRSTFEVTYLKEAVRLQEQMTRRFWDDEDGGYYLADTETTDLPVRPKEIYDGALPSANSVALWNLSTLHRLTGDPVWEERTDRLIRAFSGTIERQPVAHTQFLVGLDGVVNPGKEVVLVTDGQLSELYEFIRILNRNDGPDTVVLVKTPTHAAQLAEIAPFTAPMKTVEGKPSAYVCSGRSCRHPVHRLEDFETELAR